MDCSSDQNIQIIYEATDVTLHNIYSDSPYVSYIKDSKEQPIDSQLVAGCDGYHGRSRCANPKARCVYFEGACPFACVFWLMSLGIVMN